MESIRHHLVKEAKHNKFPAVYYTVKKFAAGHPIEGFIGLATSVRKKHTDGKWYVSNFCDYYVTNLLTNEAEATKGLITRFMAMVHAYLTIGKIIPEMELWSLDHDQRSEEERVYEIQNPWTHKNPYRPHQSMRRKISSSGNVIIHLKQNNHERTKSKNPRTSKTERWKSKPAG